MHSQKVWKVFEITNLGECHDLCVQCDTMYVPAHFLFAPGLAWQPCHANYNTLLTVEKGIRGGIL